MIFLSAFFLPQQLCPLSVCIVYALVVCHGGPPSNHPLHTSRRHCRCEGPWQYLLRLVHQVLFIYLCYARLTRLCAVRNCANCANCEGTNGHHTAHDGAGTMIQARSQQTSRRAAQQHMQPVASDLAGLPEWQLGQSWPSVHCTALSMASAALWESGGGPPT